MNSKTHVLILGLCIFALWLAGLFIFTRELYSVDPNQLTSKDAVVVLTGGTNRLQTGFILFEKGLGKKLFISGVYRGVEVRELMQLWGSERPDSMECCVALGDAMNTIQNARETVDWLRHEDMHSLYLVTSNYHMRRALLEFRQIAPDLDITPYPVMPNKMDVNNWWRDATIRPLVIREYSKYLLAVLRHAVIL